jgi:group I intron endonuclease
MKYHIYIHQNIANLKIYVGYSNNPNRRWQETKRIAYDITHRSYPEPFYNAIRKNGWNNFTHQIIEEWDNKKDALEAEKFWISFFRSNRKVYGPNYGYNLTDGGEGGHMKGHKMSPTTKEKLLQANIGKKHTQERETKRLKSRQGYKHSATTKKNISLSQKGKKLSSDHIEKLSKSHIGTGMKNTNASKLTREQVLEIRASVDSNATLSHKYGVSTGTIWNIMNYKTWKNIE